MFDDLTLAETYGEPDFDALKAQAAELIRFIHQPIADGDLGLAEAERRIREIEAAVVGLCPAHLPFEIADRIEDITEPVFAAMADRLNSVIEGRPARTRIGAMIKLRYLCQCYSEIECLQQIRRYFEREGRR